MFRSFFLAGFECATGYNVHGEWIDQVAATQHDHHVEEDYARLAEVEIHALREAIRWPLVDRRGRHDFSSVLPFVDAARRYHLDVVWDLFHYGYPDDLDPFSAEFVQRFGDYCRAAAEFVAAHMPGPHFFTPVNEPSYFSWAAGEVGHFAPHQKGRGFELKVNLVRAALCGIAAIREACPDARIVNVDPICRVAPRSDSPGHAEEARGFNDHVVFQFWDMLTGRLRPDLGGRPDVLDVVGLNYYWTNQWQLGAEGQPLAPSDPRRVPLAELVEKVWRRYGADIVITETSALGEERASWVHELSSMAEHVLDRGVRLGGICLYPILGMPEWHAQDQWARMGLWDLEEEQQILQRKVCAPMLDALSSAQSRRTARGVGEQRRFTLAQTGGRPLEVTGTLVFHAADADRGYELRLIRSDRPYTLWVAGVGIRTAEGIVRHVSTAASLGMLVETLRWYTPTTIVRELGLSGAALPADVSTAWQRELDALLAQRARLEQFPRCHLPPANALEAVSGG